MESNAWTRFHTIAILDAVGTENRLTQRAADRGYAPRFLSICLALGFFRFGGESTLPPTGANAGR